jgi:hypothetical protein
MGFLVIHSSTEDFRPSTSQVSAFIDLLTSNGIIRPTDPPKEMEWDGGPNWSRLGIPSGSSPMMFSVKVWDALPSGDKAWVSEEWERTLARQYFTATVWDAGHPEDVDRSDPIWMQMEQAIGSPLSMLYYHI